MNDLRSAAADASRNLSAHHLTDLALAQLLVITLALVALALGVV